jgi:acetyl esterase
VTAFCPGRIRELRRTLRIKAGAVVTDSFFRTAAAAGRLHPLARPERHDVEVLRDFAYVDDGLAEHRLDVWRPARGRGPRPVVLYVHGGGFRILSKDTHWVMALSFARRGYLVVSINYRLAPRHPYPAAIADACAAYRWTVANAAQHGGDLGRLVLAGESAGANLVAALVVAACWRREEPWARAVWDTGVVPRAAVPACGLLQVSDAERFERRKKLPLWLRDRIHEVEHAYLRGVDLTRRQTLELADPLVWLEKAQPPERPLPPFFAPVGTRDPLLDDTRRLKAALDRLGAVCEARYYAGQAHAFHAMVFRRAARRCWGDAFDFLERQLGSGQTGPDAAGSVSVGPAVAAGLGLGGA